MVPHQARLRLVSADLRSVGFFLPPHSTSAEQCAIGRQHTYSRQTALQLTIFVLSPDSHPYHAVKI